MEKGMDFLKSQVNNAVMQHEFFVNSLRDHEKQAEDQRYRDLCARFIPRMEQHQQQLEAYAKELGAEGGMTKNITGKALNAAKSLADTARTSDFLRLVEDIVSSRQSEDTFKTFREAGKQLGNTRLAQIGEMGERDHDDFHREANRLVQTIFVEHVRGVEPGAGATRTATTMPETRA